jgi:hypothetical protein
MVLVEAEVQRVKDAWEVILAAPADIVACVTADGERELAQLEGRVARLVVLRNALDAALKQREAVSPANRMEA